MHSSARRADGYVAVPNDWKPGLGIARMASSVQRNEKCYWLLQVRVTPYNASKAGLKYEPLRWSGTPLIRVIWVNRGDHLAEYQEWLEDGEEVQVPSAWQLNVDEAIDVADQYSNLGSAQTAEWLQEAQATSTLIEDAVQWEEAKSLMARNRSMFGPSGQVQRNGFPQQLRAQKFLESNRVWRNS